MSLIDYFWKKEENLFDAAVKEKIEKRDYIPIPVIDTGIFMNVIFYRVTTDLGGSFVVRSLFSDLKEGEIIQLKTEKTTYFNRFNISSTVIKGSLQKYWEPVILISEHDFANKYLTKTV